MLERCLLNTAFLSASFVIACASAACTASNYGGGAAGSEEQLVDGSLSCTAKDACKYAGDGDLEACVRAITLRPTSDGKVRIDVRTSAPDGESIDDVVLSSDGPARLSGARIEASFDGGEYWFDLAKKGNGYEGQLTVEQDFPFDVTCSRIAAQPSTCSFGDATHAVGDTFPAADGCNTCTCTEHGISCTEMACAPSSACRVGDRSYAVGETFPAGDGCNTCKCNSHGISCTELACP